MAGLWKSIEAVTGSKPDPEQVEKFRRYLDLLLTWNHTHRLTGARTPESIVRDLLQDSVLFLTQVPAGANRLVDLGTGPGIPGLPIRIVRPDLSTTLVESKRKRVSFLCNVKRELKLADVRILEGRAETLLETHRDLQGAFDLAVSRSVGDSLFPTAMAYLRPRGLYIFGSAPGRELPQRSGVLSMRSSTVSFPYIGVERSFIVARRGD